MKKQTLFSRHLPGNAHGRISWLTASMLVVLLLTSPGCGPTGPAAAPTTLPFNQPAATLVKIPTTAPTPTPTAAQTSIATAPASSPEDVAREALEISWAMSASTDSETADPDMALGEPDAAGCSEPVLPTWAPAASEQPQALTLSYPAPLLARRIDIILAGDAGGILRVEAQNSFSGLGKLVYEKGSVPVNLPGGEQCPTSLSLPVETDFEVDTIIITVGASEKPTQIDAAGLAGKLPGYVDLPVFWRVPLPGTPAGLAAGQNGLIFAATGPNGLHTYDVEGNLLKVFSIPSEASLTDVTVDSLGNPVVVDSAYGWFIVLSPAGEQLTAGGDGLRGHAAVNPQDGNLYILKGNSVLVYTTDTSELLRELPLDEINSYTGLAFDPHGRLFTLRNPGWEPDLFQLDPLTGKELDAVPLARSNYPIETDARDLAIDGSGNFYILYSMTAGNIAVHMHDPQGDFVRRFGKLSSNPDGWPEGEFLDPRAITVTSDGRFILVADGYDSLSYLTAFLMETEE